MADKAAISSNYETGNYATGSYQADGIQVDLYRPRQGAPRSNRPIVCVHGGTQASWAWEEFGPVFAAAGFDVHALNWRGRNGSADISEDDLLTLSIRDVVPDIEKVAARLDTRPILVGHSMGGLASQLYAERFDVQALLLLAPVVPKETDAEPIDVPIEMTSLWEPPSPEIAVAMFFDGLTPEQRDRNVNRIVPESPLRCYEATRITVSIDPDRIRVPVLVVSGGDDRLTPPASGKALAELYNAEHRVLPGFGHNMLLGERARRTAQDLVPWLRIQDAGEHDGALRP